MLENVAFGLDQVLAPFQSLFTTKTHPVSQKALCYIRGLFKSEKNRANCTSISDSLGELDHQSFNHLLCDSPWDYQQVLRKLSLQAQDLFAKDKEVGFLIDEVGFRKKGKHSACIGRQYLGCIGKQDNGQVAVVAGLTQGRHYCPINLQLYMPHSWADDANRRAKAKIPKHIQYQTKPQMALDMIRQACSTGIKFDYVAFDSLYGSSYELIRTLDHEGIPFIGDVKENVHIYTEKPDFRPIEKRERTRGRKPKYPKTDHKTCSLEQYFDSLDSLDDFKRISFRDGTKQKITALFHQKQIWICTDKKKGTLLMLQLIIRKDTDGTVKYSFCNMHQDSLEQIVARQGQRVFVERIFQEGKNELGMGDYQVRSWEGFHKHMTLCFLAFYYVASQKVKYDQEIPLTSPMIRKLVAATIVSRWQSLDQTIELCMEHINHYQNQKLRNLNRSRIT